MMMKKIISCVMLMMMLMCVTEVSAQWSVTPEAGMNVTKYKDSPAAVGFKAGAAVSYTFGSGLFSLQSGLYYVQRGAGKSSYGGAVGKAMDKDGNWNDCYLSFASRNSDIIWQMDGYYGFYGQGGSLSLPTDMRIERIYVNECEDSIVITNPGSFLPQTVEAVLQPTYNPPFYRNQLLADAMVKFHMIDTATSGIKKVYRIQKEKFFPLPDYNLSNVNQVAVTVYGKILDEKYTQLLYKNNESLDLETVFLLDKIQKHVQITKEQAVRLKKRGLVEGRYPNIYVSFKVASMVGKKAEYVHNKGLDENICRQLILEALKNAPTTQHELLEVLDVGALPGHLSTEQKSRKLSNILQKMKKEGLVKPTGSRRYAVWSLV